MGGGALSLKIAEKGCHVYGIDISGNAINRANRLADREKLAAEFRVVNAEQLPYPDSYFDKIVSSSSLEHFEGDTEALKEMNRVLKVDGILVLTTDTFLYLKDGRIGEKHRKVAEVVNYYTQEDLREKLKISGFSIIRSKYLHRSPMAGLLCKLGLRLTWRGFLWMGISFAAYPLTLLSERLFETRNNGYALIVKAKKRQEVLPCIKSARAV